MTQNFPLDEGRLGLYIHWPFCLARCPYCDFNTFVRDGIDYDAWLSAYLSSLDHYAGLTRGRGLSSVFFGGGTPSLMKPDHVAAILARVRELWSCSEDIEITLEANPTSVEIGKLRAFADAGVNRISLGVQALNDKDLAFLGREHDVKNAMQAIEISQNVFERASFDLIYARPEQSLKDWEAELRAAAALSAGHLSLYQLTIEQNTPFHFDFQKGLFSIPDQDLAADFYDLTQDVLGAAGMPAYEVSNHARAGEESRHNLIYWEYDDYIGIGPGAHGRLSLEGGKVATRDHASLDGWMKHVGKKGHGTHPHKILSALDQVTEALMMGLRLRKGVSLQAHYWDCLDECNVKTLADQGWLEFDAAHMRLTCEGRLRLNTVLPYILRDDVEG
ncbi:MAG: radical SAM family heme chaperone HemW [Alphaproteobacteria bacterium]